MLYHHGGEAPDDLPLVIIKIDFKTLPIPLPYFSPGRIFPEKAKGNLYKVLHFCRLESQPAGIFQKTKHSMNDKSFIGQVIVELAQDPYVLCIYTEFLISFPEGGINKGNVSTIPHPAGKGYMAPVGGHLFTPFC